MRKSLIKPPALLQRPDGVLTAREILLSRLRTTNALISLPNYASVICVFVVRICKIQVSHDATHLLEEDDDNLFKIPVGYKAHEGTKHIYTKWRK